MLAKKVILGVVATVCAVVLLLTAVVAMQPSEFHVSRTAKMDAAPEDVFDQVNDFHAWDHWSPWLEEDPQAKGTYEGSASGKGAIFRWAGNENVGEGDMEIVESRPAEYVRIKLHFIKPFEDTATTEFQIKPDAAQSSVTWSMTGRHNFLSKAICLFLMDMDQMIGSKYEEGLANIKKIVEASEKEAEASPVSQTDQSEDGGSGAEQPKTKS